MKTTAANPVLSVMAFLCLCFVCSELHEQAHIQTGYGLLHPYGSRDFNTWQTAPGAGPVWLATLAGPLFSYTLAWVGCLLLRQRALRPLGVVLVFAALPFAHILTVFAGGGDERI